MFNSSVAVGTPYTFSYLLDSSVPSTYSDPTHAQYNFPGANYGATAAFGDYKFTPSANGINFLAVGNGNGKTVYNGFNLVSQNETATGFGSPTTAPEVFLEGESSTGFFSSSAMPPLSAYNVANFDFLHFVMYVQIGNKASGVSGSVTSLKAELVDPNVTPVPEASTTVSLGLMLGLGGLVLAVRRRKTASR